MSRYASPTTDILYYFSCCTLKEFRQKHFAELLNVYHRKLSEALKRLVFTAEFALISSYFDKQNFLHFQFGFGSRKIFPIRGITTATAHIRKIRNFGGCINVADAHIRRKWLCKIGGNGRANAKRRIDRSLWKYKQNHAAAVERFHCRFRSIWLFVNCMIGPF